MTSVMPATVQAGTTVAFTRDIPEYSAANGWSYVLTVVGMTKKLSIPGIPNGNAFDVLISATDTASLIGGEHKYSERVSKAGDVYEVGVGRFAVTPDLAAVGVKPGDQRSHPRKVLEAIEAVLENRATMDQESYQIAGRALSRTPITDLLLLRDKYREEVRYEAGGGDRHIRARLVRV